MYCGGVKTEPYGRYITSDTTTPPPPSKRYLGATGEDLLHALPLPKADAEVPVAAKRAEAGAKRVAHAAQARQGAGLPPQDDGQPTHLPTPAGHEACHGVRAWASARTHGNRVS